MPQSRPPAHVVYGARFLVPRTFLLARGVRALSAVDLDGGTPVLLVPLPRSLEASLVRGAVECWNRHAPAGSPRGLLVVREASTDLLVAEATVSTGPIRVRSPAERTRLRAQAATIGASLDAAGLALPDASVADLALAGAELSLTRPAVPAVEGGPPLATLLPLLIPEPAHEPATRTDHTPRARAPAESVRRRVRPLALAAAIAASAVGYVVVGAALPQRGGVEQASAARPYVAREVGPVPRPRVETPPRLEPTQPTLPPARGGAAEPVRRRPVHAQATRPPAPAPAPVAAAARVRVARAPVRPSAPVVPALPAPAIELVPDAPLQLPLAPMIPG